MTDVGELDRGTGSSEDAAQGEGVAVVGGVVVGNDHRGHDAQDAQSSASPPVILMMSRISTADAERGSPEGASRSRRTRLVLRGGGGARLHAVSRLPGRRHTR